LGVSPRPGSQTSAARYWAAAHSLSSTDLVLSPPFHFPSTPSFPLSSFRPFDLLPAGLSFLISLFPYSLLFIPSLSPLFLLFISTYFAMHRYMYIFKPHYMVNNLIVRMNKECPIRVSFNDTSMTPHILSDDSLFTTSIHSRPYRTQLPSSIYNPSFAFLHLPSSIYMYLPPFKFLHLPSFI